MACVGCKVNKQQMICRQKVKKSWFLIPILFKS